MDHFPDSDTNDDVGVDNEVDACVANAFLLILNIINISISHCIINYYSS